MGVWRSEIRRKRGGVMFGYVLLVILVTAGVTLVESFLIAFVAGLLGIGVSFKVFFFLMFVINFFIRGGSSK